MISFKNYTNKLEEFLVNCKSKLKTLSKYSRWKESQRKETVANNKLAEQIIDTESQIKIWMKRYPHELYKL